MTDSRSRVPPGQALTTEWPVLTYGDTPRVDTSRWTFGIFGEVEAEQRIAWDGYHMRGDPWLEERFGGRVPQTMQQARPRKARE